MGTVTSTLAVQTAGETGITPPVKVNMVDPAVGAKVAPPHPADNPMFGEGATFIPVGRLSVNATPVKDTVFSTGLVIVNVNVLTSPRVIVSGVKDLLINGGEMTVNVRDAVLPVPPLVEETFPLVFGYSPPVKEVVPTTTVQLPFAVILPPVRLTVSPEPVTSPPHCDPFGGDATVNPAGKVSVKATPVRATEFGLVIVKVSAEVALAATGLGEKFLLITGGSIP